MARRTLAIHPGAIGDLLLAVPALRLLRRNGGVILAAQSHVGGLLAALGEIDDSVRFDALGLDALFAGTPRDERLAPVRDAARVVCWFGAGDPAFRAALLGIAREAIVAPSVSPGLPVWRHLLDTLGESTPPDLSPCPVSRALAADGHRALMDAGWDGRPLLVVHPGASGRAKRWPVAGFVAALDASAACDHCALAVHEGPTDAEAARELRAALGDSALHLDNLPLPDLAGALAHATAWLGNDSGVSHLAAAVGVPAVVVYSRATMAWEPWASCAETVVVSMQAMSRDDISAVASRLGRLLDRATARVERRHGIA